jgi:hypothetical protein
MFTIESNQLPETENNNFAAMSDKEFYWSCAERYKKPETENNLPYKTVTFKQGERGLYSDDLKKIALIDKDSNNSEVEVGVPYLVQVIRDTKPDVERGGAIILKIIKMATCQDIIKNEETKEELHQFTFTKSANNPDEVVNKDLGVTLVDKKSMFKIQPKESWIGRVENKGKINIFKPITMAEKWKDYSILVSADTDNLYVEEVNRLGLKVEQNRIIYLTDENIQDVIKNFDSFDGAVLTESLNRQKNREAQAKIRQEEYKQAETKAKEWAWQEYMKNDVKVERVDDQNNYSYYKVKIDGIWHDVNFRTEVKTSTEIDWRELVPRFACEIATNEQYFLERLRQFENINIKFEDFTDLVPKKDFVVEKQDGLSGACCAFEQFRKMNCEEKIVDLPYVNGKLIFDPRLFAVSHFDFDYGLHKADSTAEDTYRVLYGLRSEELNYTNVIKELPEHVADRIKDIIGKYVNILTQPRSLMLEVEIAEWVDNFNLKLDEIKKLSFTKRNELLKLPIESSKETKFLKERVTLSEKEFKNLLKSLPVEKFTKINGDHSLSYFGLPVKRVQHCEERYYSRSGFGSEVPVIGKYDFKFEDITPEQISYWLDSHREYFDKLMEKVDVNELNNKLPILDKTIDEEINYRCKLMGAVRHNNSIYGFDLAVNNNTLNLQVSLTDDFSDLDILVENINSGMSGDSINVQEIFEFLKEKQWPVREQIKIILQRGGLDENKVNLLKNEVKPKKLSKDEELPFKAI